MKGWGGKRHTAKPICDAGLVLKALKLHDQMVADLGPYEAISASSGVDPVGLMKNLPLISALVDVEKSCEIHSQPLRAALQQLLLSDTSLNQSKFNGQVWISLRIERLTALLNHFRALCRDAKVYQSAALKLKSADMIQLKAVMDVVELRPLAGEPLGKGSPEQDPLEKGSPEQAPLEKGTDDTGSKLPSTSSRSLKPTLSEVSIDSSGYPAL